MYHARLEPTISDLQAQIDELSHTLREQRGAEGRLAPVEQRLAQLTARCAEIVDHWAEVDHRRAQAVGDVESRLAEWGAIEGRLQQDSARRIREFEHTIEHEWKSLRQIHEEPARQLREQAAALGEICVAAANLALQGFERAEARVAALERDLQGRLTQLSTDQQTILAEIRREGPRPAQLGTGVAPFPIEGVMRIHEELRESGKAESAPDVVRAIEGPAGPPDLVAMAEAAASAPVEEPRQIPAATALADRMSSLEREVTSERAEVRDTATRTDRVQRASRLSLGIVVAVLLIASVLGVLLQRRVNARLDEAASRVALAESASDAANRQMTATKAAAEQQISLARQSAQRAEIVSDVLAAPDLVRFNLVGADVAERAYAQALWSRTRGLVLSVSRMPAAPDGSTYQLWLMTDGAPVNAGAFVPDAAGRATLATDNPPPVPRVVIGAMVTLEPAGPTPAPTGTVLLARPRQ
jgi:hypothetical protein